MCFINPLKKKSRAMSNNCDDIKAVISLNHLLRDLNKLV